MKIKPNQSMHYLQKLPVCSDTWEAARELIPGGKDKDFLIVYLPKKNRATKDAC